MHLLKSVDRSNIGGNIQTFNTSFNIEIVISSLNAGAITTYAWNRESGGLCTGKAEDIFR